MVKNYLKIAFRNLLKHKAFSFINIFGLATGMAACILILQYVDRERSYDNFHEKGDRLFRLQQNRYDGGKLSTQWAAGAAGIGKLIKENFPEVESVARLSSSRAVTSYNGKVFREDKLFFATPEFLKMFSYKIIKGDTKDPLKEPFSIVMTQSTVKKYFGDEDPIGKIILRNNQTQETYKVTAVVEDPPINSHFKFSMLFPFSNFVKYSGPKSETTFWWDGFYTYALIKKGSDLKSLEKKISDLAQKTMESESGPGDARVEYKLQPIRDIHLYSAYMGEVEVGGDGKAVDFLHIIAFFIIIIAWINYVNLSTARSVDRAKEVGIRKVMGSLRSQLIRQFMFESVMINFFAVILCILLILLSLPFFGKLTGKEFDLDLFVSSKFWSTLTLLFFVGSFFSGLYPAFALSSFRPIEVLKGKLSKRSRGAFLRQGLVVIQFASTVALIIGTFCVYKQLKFMQSQDVGMKLDQTLVIKGPNVFDSIYGTKLSPFKDELKKISGVERVTASTSVPGKKVGWNAGGVYLVSEGEKSAKQYRPIGVDIGYIETYGLKILKGRGFEESRPSDVDAVLFNEEAVKLIGKKPEELLGKELEFWGQRYNIIGIVSNHHQESLKQNYDAHIYRLIPNVADYYSLKIQGANAERVLAGVKEAWQRTFPENPFDYFFLDDHFQKQYEADSNFGKTFGLFAVLAVVIACLGLLGLASYVTTQRTKEIGIKKILGASVSTIIFALTKDFMKPILISFVIAIPITYFLISQWLQNYAFKMNINPLLFILPVILVVLVAVGTIFTQTIKAASLNPIKNLRTE